jgi:hypothetical protein
VSGKSKMPFVKEKFHLAPIVVKNRILRDANVAECVAVRIIIASFPQLAYTQNLLLRVRFAWVDALL